MTAPPNQKINPKRKWGSESIFREHVRIRFCKTEEDVLSPNAEGEERKVGGSRCQ